MQRRKGEKRALYAVRLKAAQKRLKMNPVTRRKGEKIGSFRKRQAVSAKRASDY